MSASTWAVLVVVAAAVLAGLVALTVRWWRRFRVEWTVLDWGVELHSRAPAPGVEPDRVVAAVMAARVALSRLGPWSASLVTRATWGIQVYVMPLEEWQNLEGKLVAGEQLGRVVYVGPSLSALCHEMAHRCEEVSGDRVDLTHESWAANGIRAALAEFERWRLSGSSEMEPDREPGADEGAER